MLGEGQVHRAAHKPLKVPRRSPSGAAGRGVKWPVCSDGVSARNARMQRWR